MSLSAAVGIGQSVFGATRTRFAALPREGKLLAGAGGANLAFGHGGLLDTPLNIAAVLSIFCPALMPFVAAGYLAKSGFDLLRAGKCLFKGDITGCITNVAAGVINAYCAIPGLNGLTNVLKAGAVKATSIGAGQIENYTVETLTKELKTGTEALANIDKGLVSDLGKVNKSIVDAAEKAGIPGMAAKEGKEAALALGKEEFESQVIAKTEEKLVAQTTEKGIAATTETKLAEKVTKDRIESQVKQAGEKAVRDATEKKLQEEAITQAKEAAEKTARQEAEKAIRESIEKEATAQLEAFKELITKRNRISEQIPQIAELGSKVGASNARVEEAIQKFKAAHGREPTMQELGEVLDLKNNPLHSVKGYWNDWDMLDKLIKDGATETYNVKMPDGKVVDNAGLFNRTYDRASGYARTAKDRAGEYANTARAKAGEYASTASKAVQRAGRTAVQDSVALPETTYDFVATASNTPGTLFNLAA